MVGHCSRIAGFAVWDNPWLLLRDRYHPGMRIGISRNPRNCLCLPRKEALSALNAGTTATTKRQACGECLAGLRTTLQALTSISVFRALTLHFIRLCALIQGMNKQLGAVRILLVAGTVLSVGALAQQSPAAKPAKASSASTNHKAISNRSTPLVLNTQKAKASYAIGINIAHSLQRDKIEVDPAILLQGLNDELGGKKLLMTEEEAKAAITSIQADARTKHEAEVKAMGEKNKKDGDDFLAANKTKEGVITLSSGLQYKVLKQGDGPKPTATDTVVCNYRGTFVDGKEFDSSYTRGEPATFPVGRVIKGWTEILQLMPVGSKYQVFVPADLAYGEHASPQIGPNATLLFDIELLSIKENPAAAAAPAATTAPTTAAGTTPPEKTAKEPALSRQHFPAIRAPYIHSDGEQTRRRERQTRSDVPIGGTSLLVCGRFCATLRAGAAEQSMVVRHTVKLLLRKKRCDGHRGWMSRMEIDTPTSKQMAGATGFEPAPPEQNAAYSWPPCRRSKSATSL